MNKADKKCASSAGVREHRTSGVSINKRVINVKEDSQNLNSSLLLEPVGYFNY
jgi:hypothetical protein